MPTHMYTHVLTNTHTHTFTHVYIHMPTYPYTEHKVLKKFLYSDAAHDVMSIQGHGPLRTKP